MVFGITTAEEYRKKVEADLAALMGDIANGGLAINAVTSTYHLHEWLWAKQLKPMNPSSVRGTLVSSKGNFVAWLEAECPRFNLVQELTNGSKHAFPVSSNGTQIEGYGEGPYGVGPYGAPYLLLDLGPNVADRYLVASAVIRDAGTFMVSLAKELRRLASRLRF